MDGLVKEFADAILKVGVIRFGAFRLAHHEKNADAPLSPIYFEFGNLRSDQDATDVAVRVLQTIISPLDFDYIAEVPRKATQFVSVLAYKLRVPMVSPHEPKTHGGQGNIYGNWESGKTVLLIDDLITKATSKFAAASILEQNGLIVRDVAVLLDREEGGQQELLASGISLHAACTQTELLRYYLEHGDINPDRYEKVRAYLGHK